MAQISFGLFRWLWAFLLAATAVSGCTGTGQIMVAVTNNSGMPIQAVAVRYTGGAAQLGPLKVGERQEAGITPSGESHIELDIYLDNGKVEHRQVDTYFEKGYQGVVEITLSGGLAVNTSAQLSVR